MDAQARLAAMLREQSGWCRKLGSPLYAHLLEESARDVEAGGPAWEVLRGHEGDDRWSALALRFVGGVHRIVLEGRAPELARHYPSAGGSEGIPGAWPALRAALAAHAPELRALVDRPVQTNEVGRSAVLLGGFLLLARAHGLPLRLLEIGASAGLNLRWDHYRYEGAGVVWGDAASPVRLTDVFEVPPPLAVTAEVNTRAGCDASPVDPTTDEGALTLKSYLWPDQGARFAALAGAIVVARRVRAPVARADAGDWLADVLADPVAGATTVVFHSIVWQYLTADMRAAIRETLARAGARASTAAPLAWLRFEPAPPEGVPNEMRLTAWPGGSDRRLAIAHPHGRAVRWVG